MKRTPRAKNKKPFIAIVAISAIAIIGGSFAYFRYTESFDNDFKLGVATTSFTETFESPSDWTPCTETPKTLAITNTSTFAINARIKITERWEKLDENGNVIANETLPLKVDNKAMAIRQTGSSIAPTATIITKATSRRTMPLVALSIPSPSIVTQIQHTAPPVTILSFKLKPSKPKPQPAKTKAGIIN